MSSKPEGESQENREKNEPKKRHRPVIVRIFSAFGRRYRARKRHYDKEHTDERMVRWTRNVGWFTSALVVVGVLTAIIFWHQLDVMQGQLNLMGADERPWISIENLSISSDLSYDSAGWEFGKRWHITLTYQLKNYGKTPATHVVFWAHVVPIVRRHLDNDGKLHGTFIGDELNAACGWPEGSTELAVDTGQLMFPGEEWAPRTFEVEGDEKIFADAKAEKSLYGGTFLVPVCVAYRSVYSNIRGLVKILAGIPADESREAIFGDDRYRTAEGYRLGRKSRAAIDLIGEKISESDLLLAAPGFQASDIK